MPAIPLPFIVTAFLVFVLIRMMQRDTRERWFLLFVAACALQSAVVGLRWSLDPGWIRLLQPILAACLPLFAWAAFKSLRDETASFWHGLWPPAVIVSRWLLPSAIDFLLIVEFLLYGVLILRLRFPDEVLARVRIGDEWTVSYAQQGTAALLLLSALVDAVIAVAFTTGEVAVAVPAIAAMMSVILIGLAGSILAQAGRIVPGDAEPEPEPASSGAPAPDVLAEAGEEPTIVTAVCGILAQGLYRDYDLTLQRLARRTGIPARKISRAVNRLRGCSVTDLVNDYRVSEAKRLLQESDLPVTQIMLEAGFQTKSNFNRAFREIAGQTPSEYRRSKSE